MVEDARARRRAAGGARSQRITRLSVFVIANQQDVSVGGRKCRHAVHRLRRGESIFHRIALVADHPVLESNGQREVVAGRPQRTVADAAEAVRLAGECRSSEQRIEEPAADGGGSRGHGGAGEELTSIQRGPFRIHAEPPPRRRSVTPARNGPAAGAPQTVSDDALSGTRSGIVCEPGSRGKIYRLCSSAIAGYGSATAQLARRRRP